MSIQFSRYQCRACAKPVLHVRSQYVLPHLGYLIVLGFLSVDALLSRDALIASYCVLGAMAVAGLWALHSIVSLFTAGESYRCQSCGTEVSSSQRAM